MHKLLLFISVCFCYFNFLTAAKVFKCPENEISFEKIIGIRPSIGLNTNKTIFVIKSNKTNGLLMVTPVTEMCHQKCQSDPNCKSFTIFYNTSDCYGFAGVGDDLLDYTDEDYIYDINSAYFRKICLSVPDTCKSRYWALERIQGAILIGFNDKSIVNPITKLQCAQACINERSFKCRSALFIHKTRSDSTKFKDIISSTSSTDDDNSVERGECILSKESKYSQPESFRVSTYDREYLENQCLNIISTDDFCSYEEYVDSIFQHSDKQSLGVSKKECQNRCQTEQYFICHGFSYIPGNKTVSSQCLLHSEDTLALGPRLVRPYKNSVYLRRVKCLNLSVTCSTKDMVISFRPTSNFHGRMYTTGHSETCSVNGNGLQETIITIPFSDNQNSNKCGVQKALSVGDRNRTLLTTLLVIQSNQIIQTQGDRLIKVGCVLNENGTSSGSPKNITIGSTISFDEKNQLPNQGSIVINSSSITPTVTMYIIDHEIQSETQDAQLGQSLDLVFEITPADGPYDIRATHLVAQSEDKRSSILLLDDNGCPVDVKVFPALTEVRTTTQRMLVGRFQAFKFTGQSVVEFSCMVQFCMVKCEPLKCNNRRAKRQTNSTDYFHYEPTLTTTILNDMTMPNYLEEQAVVTEQNRSQYNKDSRNSSIMLKKEIPLRLRLIVYDRDAFNDKLIFGENHQILLAEIDTTHNMFCIDQILMITIIVAWLIIQIILLAGCIIVVKKYKRYADIEYDRQSLSHMHDNYGFEFPNLHRRVTWADQNAHILHT